MKREFYPDMDVEIPNPLLADLGRLGYSAFISPSLRGLSFEDRLGAVVLRGALLIVQDDRLRATVQSLTPRAAA